MLSISWLDLAAETEVSEGQARRDDGRLADVPPWADPLVDFDIGAPANAFDARGAGPHRGCRVSRLGAPVY